jgi:hypothetical protein
MSDPRRRSARRRSQRQRLAAAILVAAASSASVAHALSEQSSPRLRCAAQPVACEKALRWQQAQRRRLTREVRHLRVDVSRRFAETSTSAIRVACAAYRVSCSDLFRVARCESSLDPFATNGRYLGLFQLGPAHLSDPVIRATSPFNPYANAIHTARYVAAHGWGSQWECQP